MYLKTISATSISTYEICPLQWKYNYVYKLLQLPNPAFIVGTAYHKCLQLYHQLSTINTKEKIIEQTKEEMMPNKSDDEIDRFSLVRKMFEKYCQYPIEGKIIEIEFRFNIPLPGLSVNLYGFVDRIDQDKIVEYKTTSEDYKESSINNLQTDIYSYAVLKTKGKLFPVVYSVNNKKKINKTDYKPQVLKIQRTENDMKNLEEKCKEFYNKVEHSKFEYKQGNHCHWCPFGGKGTNNCPYSL